MERGSELWVERILEDESWRGGLTDDQAERLLQWGLDRISADPEETGETVRWAMRRISRAVQASGEEAGALLAVWGLEIPPEWTAWTVEERLSWVLQALGPPPLA